MADLAAGTRIIQRKAYQAYHLDGLLDLTIGLGILGFVIMILSGELAFLMLTWAALFLYLPVRTKVILPRLANGNPGAIPAHTVRRARHVALGLLLSVILLESLVMFAAEFYYPAQAWLNTRVWLLLGSLLGLTLAAIGVAVGVRRLAGYGGLAIVLALLQHTFNLPYFLPYLVLSLACVLVGGALLVRFLRRT